MLNSPLTAALELRHLRAAGFGAVVDALAMEGDQIWFLSMVGNAPSIKALWARLLKGETAYLAGDPLAAGVPVTLAGPARTACRFHIARLPRTGAHHALLVPEDACYSTERTQFLLLARTEEELPVLHYRFLNRRIDLPLHPAWAGWLWERAQHAGEASALEAVNLHAFRCRPDPEALADALGRALRGHRLPALPDPALNSS